MQHATCNMQHAKSIPNETFLKKDRSCFIELKFSILIQIIHPKQLGNTNQSDLRVSVITLLSCNLKYQSAQVSGRKKK